MQKSLYPKVTIQVEKTNDVLNITSKIEHKISKDSDNSLWPVQFLIDPNCDTVKNITQESSDIDSSSVGQTTQTSKADIMKRENYNQKTLLEHCADKRVAKLEYFDTDKNLFKAQGLTSGFVSSANEHYGYSNKLFMLKNFPNMDDKMESGKSEKEKNMIAMDRSDALTEFLVSDIYSLLLGKNAPKEGLVVDKESKEIFVRSKYLDNVQPIANLNKKALKEQVSACIENFEKIVAASTLLGDFDYHEENILIQKQQNQFSLCKIDHGRALITKFNNSKNFIKNIAKFFEECKYNKFIRQGYISFNLSKYIYHLETFIERLEKNREQIHDIIDSKIFHLKQANVNIKNFEARTDCGYKLNKKDQIILDNGDPLCNYPQIQDICYKSISTVGVKGRKNFCILFHQKINFLLKQNSSEYDDSRINKWIKILHNYDDIIHRYKKKLPTTNKDRAKFNEYFKQIKSTIFPAEIKKQVLNQYNLEVIASYYKKFIHDNILLNKSILKDLKIINKFTREKTGILQNMNIAKNDLALLLNLLKKQFIVEDPILTAIKLNYNIMEHEKDAIVVYSPKEWMKKFNYSVNLKKAQMQIAEYEKNISRQKMHKVKKFISKLF